MEEALIHNELLKTIEMHSENNPQFLQNINTSLVTYTSAKILEVLKN